MAATGDQVPEGTDLLSQRSEIFRSKLITDFHLLETISESGRKLYIPRYYTHDVMEQPKMVKMMMTRPQGLVRFQVYTNKEEKQLTIGDRRRNRVKNKNSKNPPIDLWANWVVNSALFQNSILVLILLNSVVLGVQAELSDYKDPYFDMLKVILDIFDYCALLVFVIEIILKWLDNFWDFWRNRWNIFDFIVTFVSFVPEIMKYSSSGHPGQTTNDLTVVAENMRTFRVLRSLKMVSRFQKVRLIVMAVTKAFQAMIFITVLLFIFAYIFAIIGVICFDYSKAEKPLMYPNSFSSIKDALITLFQLFTLDHWTDVYKDVTVVMGPGVAALYVIFWIIIGSFIFRNIFVGIMVNNFQSIRNDLFEEVVEMKEKERRDYQMAEFANELGKQQDVQHDMEDDVAANSRENLDISNESVTGER